MTDLFGNDTPAPRSRVTEPAPIALELFDHAAERAAIASGRPVSQERAELVAPGSVTPRLSFDAFCATLDRTPDPMVG